MIVQDAYPVPDDIAIGILTGLYKRFGSVVRYAAGPNKGQIVIHLKPVDLETAEQVKGLGDKLLQLIQQHKKEFRIAIISGATIGTGFLIYSKWKKHEPKVLRSFRVALKTYIEAIRRGNMDAETIDVLMKALYALKQHKNYEKINIKLTAEELDALVGRIYEYTIKFAEDNSFELLENNLHKGNCAIINLEECLKIQKRIFEKVA